MTKKDILKYIGFKYKKRVNVYDFYYNFSDK